MAVCRGNEREREKWIVFVSDMKRDTPTKTKSAKCLGYQKEDKEEEDEDDDFDKSSTRRRSKMHKRE